LGGLLLHGIATGVLGTTLATAVSGVTLLDPLYAGDRLETTWSTRGILLAIHIFHTFVTAPLTGSLIGYSASRIQDRRLYLFAIGLFAIDASFGLHYLFTFVLAIGVPLFVKQPIPGSLWVISLVITTAVAPLIGLLAAYYGETPDVER